MLIFYARGEVQRTQGVPALLTMPTRAGSHRAALSAHQDPMPSAPIRRSQRLAQKSESEISKYTPPPAPKLDASPVAFEGPRPTWLTGDEPKPSSPSIAAEDAPNPHHLPPLSLHALDAMPSQPGVRGVGITLGMPKATTKPASKDDASSTPSSSRASSDKQEPTDTLPPLAKDIKVPQTPRLLPLVDGKFPPNDLPAPDGILHRADDKEAHVPSRASLESALSKRTKAQRPPVSLDRMPQECGLAGLGISMPSQENKAPEDGVAGVMDHLERLSLKSKPTSRKPFGERSSDIDVLSSQGTAHSSLSKTKQSSTKPPMSTSKPKVGDKAPLLDKASKVTPSTTGMPLGMLDENGRPISYKAPTKRYPTFPDRKRRSSVSAPRLLHDRTAFAVHRSYTRPAVGAARPTLLR